MPDTFAGIDPQLLMMNPAAFGRVPNIPPTSTAVTTPTPQFPLYQPLSQRASELTQTELSGQLPADVIAQITQQAAERGIATGSPGSPQANAAFLRALGLTSLGMMGQGMRDYTSLLATSPRQVTQVTPNDVLRAIYAAAPDPYSAAMSNLAAQGLGMGGLRAVGAPTITAPPARTAPLTSPYEDMLATIAGPTGYGRTAAPYDPTGFGTQEWLASIGWTPTLGTRGAAPEYPAESPIYAWGDWGGTAAGMAAGAPATTPMSLEELLSPEVPLGIIGPRGGGELGFPEAPSLAEMMAETWPTGGATSAEDLDYLQRFIYAPETLEEFGATEPVAIFATRTLPEEYYQ